MTYSQMFVIVLLLPVWRILRSEDFPTHDDARTPHQARSANNVKVTQDSSPSIYRLFARLVVSTLGIDIDANPSGIKTHCSGTRGVRVNE